MMRVRRLAGVALVVLAAGIVPAHAQMGGMGGMGGGGGHHGQRPQPSAASPGPPAPNPVAEPWPRLEQGSILCKTRDDLTRYQARLAGDQSSAQTRPLDCRIMQERTAIKILERDGPGQTEVALPGATPGITAGARSGATPGASGETGWTDTYLPTTPPGPA